jgi:ribosome recycling factor
MALGYITNSIIGINPDDNIQNIQINFNSSSKERRREEGIEDLIHKA